LVVGSRRPAVGSELPTVDCRLKLHSPTAAHLNIRSVYISSLIRQQEHPGSHDIVGTAEITCRDAF
jgi:hypothetical protein